MDNNYRYYENKGIGVFEFLHEKLNADNSSDTVDTMKNIVSKKNIANFILDLTKVASIDSIGIGFLIAIKNAAAKKGSIIHLVSDSDLVTRVLYITRMETFFKIFRCLNDAVAYVEEKKSRPCV